MSDQASQRELSERDLEVMLRADGEDGDGSELTVAERAKLEGVLELGEVIKTYLELETDKVEPKLDALWSAIERDLAVPASVAQASSSPARAAAAAPAPGLWARVVGWFDEHRGHFLTGAMSAGAVAALFLVLRPPTERIIERQVAAPVRATEVAPVTMRSTAPEIETLEVLEGTGTVFSIPDEDGEGGTAVIWISPDETTVEGPI